MGQPDAYWIEPEQLEQLRAICKLLYGTGEHMTADVRRDLANTLNRLVGDIATQTIDG